MKNIKSYFFRLLAFITFIVILVIVTGTADIPIFERSIAAGGDVVNGAGEFETKRAGHGRDDDGLWSVKSSTDP